MREKKKPRRCVTRLPCAPTSFSTMNINYNLSLDNQATICLIVDQSMYRYLCAAIVWISWLLLSLYKLLNILIIPIVWPSCALVAVILTRTHLSHTVWCSIWTVVRRLCVMNYSKCVIAVCCRLCRCVCVTSVCVCVCQSTRTFERTYW